MKKTLVAAAALATLGTAAFAQSSVTLYGRMDASIGSTKSTQGGVTLADPGVSIVSGGHTGSRWGLMGSEDLGGGLKANFTLEQGFNVDDGSASNAANQFHRQAFVGLSGGFGSLNIGRQYDLIDQFYGNYDVFGNSGYSSNVAFSNANAAGRRLGDHIVRQNNAVQYISPNMSGFQARVFLAPDENAVGNSDAVGLSLNYAGGPFAVGFAYQQNDVVGAGGTTAADLEQWVLGASYDLGVAKVFGQYQAGKNKTANTKDDGYNLGVTMPLGAFGLTFAYAAEDQKTGGAKVSDTAAYSIMGQYNLSKRTYVYAAYRRSELDPVGPVSPIKDRKYGLGLVHLF